MRPARLCREMTTPTWLGRAPLHAAVISCCVLPVAKARTCSPRVGEVRLPPAGFAVAVRGRPRGRAGAAALVAVVGALAEAVFFARVPLLYRASTRSVASSSLELAGERLALRTQPFASYSAPLLTLGALLQSSPSAPSRQNMHK